MLATYPQINELVGCTAPLSGRRREEGAAKYDLCSVDDQRDRLEGARNERRVVHGGPRLSEAVEAERPRPLPHTAREAALDLR